MIRGERGSGKELVARALHLKATAQPIHSRELRRPVGNIGRNRAVWMRERCFHRRRVPNRPVRAGPRRTLFLDEVGELSPLPQPKLLRVVETLEVDRVGGQRPIPVDFRLVVATNRNLEEMVRAGKFRDDLYDRLNMDSIRLPPLRERLEDIPRRRALPIMSKSELLEGRCAQSRSLI